MTDSEQWAFGRRLQAAREARDLSIRRAAALAQISEGRWRQLEAGYNVDGAGNHKPIVTTPNTILKVTRALDLNSAEMLALGGFDQDDPEVEAAFAVVPPKEFIDVSDLDDEQRAKVRAFADFIRSEKHV